MNQSMKELLGRAALIGVALPALCLLSACSSGLLDSKTIEYKSASNKTLPPLELPPGLSTPRSDDRFALPDGTSAAPSTTLSVYNAERAGQNRQAAGSTNLLPDVAKVRIERSGSQRWLVVPEIPEKVWPTVKEFWQESGFLVNLELLEAGVMETDWAENRAKIPQDALRNLLGKVLDGMYSTSERDKFRTRLERGTEAGTTEIYISHRGVQEVFTNQRQERSVWQPRPSDPELEAEFLRRLMSRFGVEDQRAKAQVAAAEAPQRAKLLPAKDGAGALDLQEPFDRAWRRVGLALDRVGFTVEDRDRSKGTYFVRYVDPDIDAQNRRQEDSALGKLMFWRSNKPAQSALQYSVFLKAGGQDTTEVRVLNKDGVSENSENSRKILALLFDQLK